MILEWHLIFELVIFWTLSDHWGLDKVASSKEKFANNKGNSTSYDKKILDEIDIVIGFISLPYTWFNNKSIVDAVPKDWIE